MRLFLSFCLFFFSFPQSIQIKKPQSQKQEDVMQLYTRPGAWQLGRQGVRAGVQGATFTDQSGWELRVSRVYLDSSA